jgi:hypothetical protein
MNRILTAILVIVSFCAFSQSVPQGFRYQTTLRNGTGTLLPSQTVRLRFSLYSGSPTGTLQWQETHLLISDSHGLLQTVIGAGISTGLGSSSAFNLINWSAGPYYLKVSSDITLSGSYSDLGTTQLFSVPYSLYAMQTESFNDINLAGLQDVNMGGNAPGKLLKWNGSFWIPDTDNDSDTVLYAYNSGHSETTDTSFYTYGNSSDTVLFSYISGSSVYSTTSGNAGFSASAVQSDTAIYAFSSAPVAWVLTGNSLTGSGKYVGTNDATDLYFRTNNIARASLRSNGKLYIGTSANSATLNLTGNDGLAATGILGSGQLSVSGPGTRMVWFPAKGAFRAGGVNGSQWDTVNIGKYSMAAGYNTKSGINSFASGNSSTAVDYSFAVGNYCNALAVGPYPSGNSISMGDSCNSTAPRSITIGKNNTSSLTTCIAIGRNNVASGSVSVVFGVNNISSANDTHVFGSNASSNGKNGAFVYGDASTTSVVAAPAINQFVVRAAGGVIFYSDSARTMGVYVSPGGGSWASVSDVNKKENFLNVDEEEILLTIQKLKIKSWNYKSQPARIRHIGPIAQDFYNAFHLGESETMITGTDIDGIILAGIKALYRRTTLLEIAYQTEVINQEASRIKNDFIELNGRLDKIETLLNNR